MLNKFNQGEVILVPFPFSDQSKVKNRPAVVVSKLNNQDLIVAKITSALKNDENCFKINNSCLNFQIDKESEVRTNTILTIEKKLVIKKLGSIKKEEMIIILDKIVENFK